MNTTIKIILGLVAGVTLICLCVGAGGLILLRSTHSTLQGTFQSDSAKVVEASASIASYTLPAGFGDAYVTDVAGFSMVSYTGDDGHSHIYFFQLPKGIRLDQAEIERQLRENTGDKNNNWEARSEIVDQVPATICGQETTLVVSEGINHDGQPYRQVSGVFEGQGGQALVVFERPVSSWDQAEVDEFLASIH